MKVHYYCQRVERFIEECLQRMDMNKVIWLGFSPALPFVYQSLLAYNIESVRVFDNDKDKWGWEINPSKHFSEKQLKIEPFSDKRVDNQSLFLTASNHYSEFVTQLSKYV